MLPSLVSSVNTASLALDETLSLIRAAWDHRERVDVETKFRIGDLINSLGLPKLKLKATLEMAFGSYLFPKFRDFACIARRWPKNRRGAKKPWRFFESTYPDGTDVAVAPRLPPDLSEWGATRVGEIYFLHRPTDRVGGDYRLSRKRLLELLDLPAGDVRE